MVQIINSVFIRSHFGVDANKYAIVVLVFVFLRVVVDVQSWGFISTNGEGWQM
jgi:hypothetical protein